MPHIVDGKVVTRKYPPNPQYNKKEEDQRRVAAWIRDCQQKKWIAGR